MSQTLKQNGNGMAEVKANWEGAMQKNMQFFFNEKLWVSNNARKN